MKTWLYAPAACLALIAAPALAQQHDHSAHQQEQEPTHDHGGHHGHEAGAHDEPIMAGHTTAGALGPYPMRREASGTAWQPDTSVHGGAHAARGMWTIMSHLMLNGVYAGAEGPRGDEKAFVAGMAMVSGRRDFTSGTLNLRAMVSPDPFMGANGYPLLLAAGESADGVTPLVDRQHPHDLFMELAASYAHRLDARQSLFVYAGLPGEPAFGPPAFMHRMAAMDSPEAPITHHWFDSTHITFGVVTAGYVNGDWKIEASQFRGREPDHRRFDIETGALDSTSVRLSWNPAPEWAFQLSYADVKSPEALHPDEDEERYSASAIYTRTIGAAGWWSTTLAFSHKARSDGAELNAWLAEAAYHPNDRWTIFARGEAIETDELGAHHGPVEDAARLSLGAIRDFRISDHAVIGLGALAQQHWVSSGLRASYGGDPMGGMAFVRLKVG